MAVRTSSGGGAHSCERRQVAANTQLTPHKAQSPHSLGLFVWAHAVLACARAKRVASLCDVSNAPKPAAPSLGNAACKQKVARVETRERALDHRTGSASVLASASAKRVASLCDVPNAPKPAGPSLGNAACKQKVARVETRESVRS